MANDIIDINVYETVETVAITVQPNLTTINVNSVTGGANLDYTPSPTNGIVSSDSGTDATIPLADSTNAGLISPSEKIKLAGIATGAEVNVNGDWNAVSGDAQILNKPSVPSIAGLATITYVDTQDALKSNIASPTFTGTVSGITKTMVGLGSVDNTSDALKPISTATQTALNLKEDKVTGKSLIADSEITRLLTLSNFDNSSNVTTLNNKEDKVTGKSLISDTEITRLATLSNFDNSSNVTALNLKEDKVTGKSLIADSEITRLATVVNFNNSSNVTALNLKEDKVNKNVANGYAGLGTDGKLISSQLPSITISETFVVASQVAMLAIVGETGDVAVRTDLNKSFILKGTNPAVLSDWQELLTPTSAVTTVFGRNGAVIAQSGDYTKAQVGLPNVDNTSDLLKPISTATQTALNLKANDNAVVHLAGTETITGIKTIAPQSQDEAFSGARNMLTVINSDTQSEDNYVDGYALYVQSSGQGIRSDVFGQGTAVLAASNTGTGLVASSGTGTGLVVSSSSGTGVIASSNGVQTAISASSNGTGTAVVANSNVGTGLVAYSNLGTGVIVSATSGTPIQTYGNGTGKPSVENNLGNSNKGLVVNSGASSTGNPIEHNKNGTINYTVNQAGETTGSKFIKTGATETNILLAGGSDITQLSLPISTATQTALNLKANTTDLTLQRVTTGAGASTTTNPIAVNTNQDIGIAATGAAYGIVAGSVEIGILSEGVQSGIIAKGGEYGIRSFAQTNTGVAGKFEVPLTSTANIAEFTKDNVTISAIQNTGKITAVAGTASTDVVVKSQLDLKANIDSPTFTGTVVLPSTTSIGAITNTELSYVDGVTSSIQTQLNGKQATLTNPVTGTGTTNFLSKFTGTTALGNSLLFDNGTNVGIGTTNPRARLDLATPDNPVTATNLLSFRNISDFGIYATSISVGSRGNTLDFLARDYNLGAGVATRNVLSLRPEGNVGIGTTAPTSKLQVVGLVDYATNALAIAGGLTVGAFYRTSEVVKVVI